VVATAVMARVMVYRIDRAPEPAGDRA